MLQSFAAARVRIETASRRAPVRGAEATLALIADAQREVREARNGADALELLNEWQPSVIMLDWRMPVMDGREVVKRLEGHPLRPRVVLVTAAADVHDIAMRHRIRFHVGKPFGLDQLLSVLDEAHEAA